MPKSLDVSGDFYLVYRSADPEFSPETLQCAEKNLICVGLIGGCYLVAENAVSVWLITLTAFQYSSSGRCSFGV